MSHRKTLLAFTLALLAACGGESAKTDTAAGAAAATQAGSGADPELADVTNYRLTMPKIDQWLQVQRNAAKAMAAMSPAERAEYRAREDQADDEKDADDMVRRIEGDPLMSKAVRDAGLTTREFALITMSVIQSGMAAAVLEMRPNDNQDSLVREMKANMENVRFMREHKDEMEQKRKAMEAELRAAGIDPDADEDEGADAGEY